MITFTDATVVCGGGVSEMDIVDGTAADVVVATT